jgi:23S rRNA (uridine2479-2'-O)-methyltransferase
MKKISTNNSTYQILQALKTNRRKRNELGEIFVEGIESIKQVRESDYAISRILFTDYDRLSDWGKGFVGQYPAAELFTISKELYKGLSDKDEPSELMITVKKKKIALEDVKLGRDPVILVFDRPSDHGNLGTIIRSANCFAVDLIITTGHAIDHFDPKVIRSSLGAIFRTNLVHEESTEKIIQYLERQKKERGVKVIGTDSAGDTSIISGIMKKPLALIIGNEAKGISVRFKEYADHLVAIPLRGNVNSLNVACAASICLWQIYYVEGVQ